MRLPITQKQLRSSDSMFENTDSKSEIFVTILKTNVAEFKISESGTRSSTVDGATTSADHDKKLVNERTPSAHFGAWSSPTRYRCFRHARRASSKPARHHPKIASFSHALGLIRVDLWSEERISTGADLSLASTMLKLEWLERVCAEASVATI